MEEKFSFHNDFQIEVLALLTQRRDFLGFCVDLVKADYFSNTVFAWLYQQMVEYYLDYNNCPSVSVLKNQVDKANKSGQIKDDDLGNYEKILPQLKNLVTHEEYIRDEITKFCRRQAVRREMRESIDLISSDSPEVWDEITSRISDACAVGTTVLDEGTHYFRDYEHRLYQKRIDAFEEVIKIPTGIKELDYNIGGGMKPGQMGVWIAPTGVGKSIALPHCGKRNVISGGTTAHYTLELNEEEVSERYDSCWTVIPISTIDDRLGEVEQRLGKLYYKYGDSLIVKFYPTKRASVHTIRNHVIHLRNEGINPNMLVIDYGDLLRPAINRRERYQELADIFEDIKGLAQELQVVIWTATQVNRAGFSADVLDLEHIAGAYDKTFSADVIVTICKNREEKMNDLARLMIAKNRNGPTGVEIEIATAYDKMIFYNSAASDNLEEHKARKAMAVSNPSVDQAEDPGRETRKAIREKKTPAGRRKKKRRPVKKVVDFPLGDKE